MQGPLWQKGTQAVKQVFQIPNQDAASPRAKAAASPNPKPFFAPTQGRCLNYFAVTPRYRKKKTKDRSEGKQTLNPQRSRRGWSASGGGAPQVGARAWVLLAPARPLK